MKTTIEIEDELFRRSKAEAALRGETLKEFFTAALRAHLGKSAGAAQRTAGWRSVFGAADAAAVEEVDTLVRAEFERIDPETWT
jgi:Arc/MetJ family transcription regulator